MPDEVHKLNNFSFTFIIFSFHSYLSVRGISKDTATFIVLPD